MGVYLWNDNYLDYSAMQGPAPIGFHVPLSSEWGTLCGILTTTFGLAKNATTIGTYLKMPMAGYRNTYANVSSVGTSGRYWSSFPNTVNNAHLLYFYSSNIITAYGQGRANGNSVRCFKDTPVIPTSSWTTLYDGSSVASGAGVFYNTSLGLISVSGDGNTWYTIMDKNLGATTVFNQGDTVNDANCGYFYQWGNNYGFPHSGTVTTSSTKVDTSNYGPGNYYSSDTFITVNDRSSVQNDNLWGGVTGVNHMAELKNAYIGEYRVPGENTVAYYPLNSTTTVNDMSGNNRNLTNNNVTFGTSAGVSCAYFNGSNGSLTTTSLTTATMTTNHTVSLWFNRISGEGGLSTNVPISGWNGYNMYVSSNGSTQVEVMYNGGTQFYSNYPTNTGTWHLVTYTHNSSNQVVLYVDGEQKTSGTKGFGTGNAGRLCIGAIWFYNENPKLFYNGYISNFIIENKARTAQEVADYYNLTKSNYGL